MTANPPADPADRFDALDDRIHQAVVAKREDPPPWLWHYTGVRGLHGIVSTGNIRCTHFACTNDPDELVHAKDIIRDVAHKIGSLLGGYAQDIIAPLAEKYDELEITKQADVYLACFTTKRDDLGQWVAYGDRCRGYSLKLATQRLSNPERKPNANLGIGMYRVIYDETELRKATENAFASILLDHVKPFLHSGGVQTEEDAKRVAGVAAANMLRVGGVLQARSKNPAFRAEEEWRVVGLTIARGDNPLVPEFRTDGGRLVPYVDVPLSQEGSVAVSEVVYGSALEPGPTERVTQILFGSKGANVSVSRSSVPYRP